MRGVHEEPSVERAERMKQGASRRERMAARNRRYENSENLYGRKALEGTQVMCNMRSVA